MTSAWVCIAWRYCHQERCACCVCRLTRCIQIMRDTAHAIYLSTNNSKCNLSYAVSGSALRRCSKNCCMSCELSAAHTPPLTCSLTWNGCLGACRAGSAAGRPCVSRASASTAAARRNRFRTLRLAPNGSALDTRACASASSTPLEPASSMFNSPLGHVLLPCWSCAGVRLSHTGVVAAMEAPCNASPHVAHCGGTASCCDASKLERPARTSCVCVVASLRFRPALLCSCGFASAALADAAASTQRPLEDPPRAPARATGCPCRTTSASVELGIKLTQDPAAPHNAFFAP